MTFRQQGTFTVDESYEHYGSDKVEFHYSDGRVVEIDDLKATLSDGSTVTWFNNGNVTKTKTNGRIIRWTSQDGEAVVRYRGTGIDATVHSNGMVEIGKDQFIGNNETNKKNITSNSAFNFTFQSMLAKLDLEESTSAPVPLSLPTISELNILGIRS